MGSRTRTKAVHKYHRGDGGKLKWREQNVKFKTWSSSEQSDFGACKCLSVGLHTQEDVGDMFWFVFDFLLVSVTTKEGSFHGDGRSMTVLFLLLLVCPLLTMVD